MADGFFEPDAITLLVKLNHCGGSISSSLLPKELFSSLRVRLTFRGCVWPHFSSHLLILRSRGALVQSQRIELPLAQSHHQDRQTLSPFLASSFPLTLPDGKNIQRFIKTSS
jgi:hypothetical protein